MVGGWRMGGRGSGDVVMERHRAEADEAVNDFAAEDTPPGIFALATDDLEDAADAQAEWGGSDKTPIETVNGKRQWRNDVTPEP
jgi:hypothetical protein